MRGSLCLRHGFWWVMSSWRWRTPRQLLVTSLEGSLGQSGGTNHESSQKRDTVPISGACLHYAGYIWLWESPPAKAIDAYRTAVTINQRDYRAWYGLGQTYELLRSSICGRGSRVSLSWVDLSWGNTFFCPPSPTKWGDMDGKTYANHRAWPWRISCIYLSWNELIPKSQQMMARKGTSPHQARHLCQILMNFSL